MLSAPAGGLGRLSQNGLDRTGEGLPFQSPDGETFPARWGDPVHAATSASGDCPAAPDKTVAFESVKSRVDGPFGEPEDIVAPTAQVPDDSVPVRRPGIERGEHERVQIPPR